jgi:hypothetical protein
MKGKSSSEVREILSVSYDPPSQNDNEPKGNNNSCKLTESTVCSDIAATSEVNSTNK